MDYTDASGADELPVSAEIGCYNDFAVVPMIEMN